MRGIQLVYNASHDEESWPSPRVHLFSDGVLSSEPRVWHSAGAADTHNNGGAPSAKQERHLIIVRESGFPLDNGGTLSYPKNLFSRMNVRILHSSKKTPNRFDILSQEREREWRADHSPGLR
mmetsp:Transcript_31671/g.72741  ORF Transcript_31671/g.72741 Transcript_31671/m.72741 type:complete len:122 (-) Transcript_31671:621-986(-)